MTGSASRAAPKRRLISSASKNAAYALLAIAQELPSVREALEAYRVNRDDDDLMATLRGIASEVLRTTMEENDMDIQGAGSDEEEEEDEEQSEEDDAESDEGEDSDGSEDDSSLRAAAGSTSASSQSSLGSSHSSTSGGVSDSRAVSSSSLSTDSSNGTVSFTSQAARTHIFPILLTELSKHAFLSNEQAMILLTLFEHEEDIVHAALDEYDSAGDMRQLVETLTRIAAVVLKHLAAKRVTADDNEDDEEDQDDDEDDDEYETA